MNEIKAFIDALHAIADGFLQCAIVLWLLSVAWLIYDGIFE